MGKQGIPHACADHLRDLLLPREPDLFFGRVYIHVHERGVDAQVQERYRERSFWSSVPYPAFTASLIDGDVMYRLLTATNIRARSFRARTGRETSR